MARLFVVFVTLLALGQLTSLGASAEFGLAGSPGRLQAKVIANDDAPKKENATPEPAKSAGTIDGLVTAIDYRAGVMAVSAGARKVDVTILPSTNIQGANNSFRTIADIQKGSRVRVLLSQRAGTFTAQIITLR